MERLLYFKVCYKRGKTKTNKQDSVYKIIDLFLYSPVGRKRNCIDLSVRRIQYNNLY